MRHALLVAEYLATPWALRREVLQTHVGVIARWANEVPRAMDDHEEAGERKSTWEVRREQSARAAAGTAIGVLPIYGTITQRANMMSDWSGGTSCQNVAAGFRDMMADDTVGGILLEVDSPGGSVYGVQELGDEIQAARGKKPVWGIANSQAASAGYWLLAQAEQVFVTPGGEVGSIGVWSAHDDYSKQLEMMGVKTTLISAGKYKVEGHPYGPLDEEAQAFLQSRVNEYYAAFTKAVAKGRNAPVSKVRDGMGQGRVLGADAALAEGMVDGIATFDDTLRKLAREIRRPAPADQPAAKGGRSTADVERELRLRSSS
jgi:signal peptide peptidase SppA